MSVVSIIQNIGNFLWSYPLLLLLLGVGLFLTIMLRGIQFRRLGKAIKLIFVSEKGGKGDISHFQSLMTALAATVGTGNIVGVATAIAIGGPGALFWMWITGLVGMATKFAETLLGVKYREQNKQGEIAGGPMYYISKAMKKKWPGMLYAVFGLLGAIGLGNMIQANAISSALSSSFSLPTASVALAIAILSGIIIIRGIKSVGKVTSVIVPVMVGAYFIAAITILVSNWSSLDTALGLVIKYAFNPTAATGGFIGSGVLLTMRMGVARGLFSNESGLGSAAIASAAAKTKKPVTQALIAMTQTFIDTIIVCTLTGLVIISSGVWDSGLNGVVLTTTAFASTFPLLADYVVALSLSLFAFSTIISWSYYGEKFLEYITNHSFNPIIYRISYIALSGVGAILSLELVWGIADIAAALMAIPNLIALVILLPVIRKEMKK